MNLSFENATMSSMEIAQISGKNHFDLLKAIRKMETAWQKITESKFAVSEYKDASGRKLPMYQLTKEETLYIATKFNDEARARLILRWMELEQGKATPKAAAGKQVLQIAPGITMQVIPHPDHQWVVPTKEWALAMGVKANAIRSMKANQVKKGNLVAGVHYIDGFAIGTPPVIATTVYTPKGVIQGLRHIKSGHSAIFRNWAENEIISKGIQPGQPAQLPESTRPRHNRLTPDRLADLLADVAYIEDSELRIKFMNKLTGRAQA